MEIRLRDLLAPRGYGARWPQITRCTSRRPSVPANAPGAIRLANWSIKNARYINLSMPDDARLLYFSFNIAAVSSPSYVAVHVNLKGTLVGTRFQAASATGVGPAASWRTSEASGTPSLLGYTIAVCLDLSPPVPPWPPLDHRQLLPPACPHFRGGRWVCGCTHQNQSSAARSGPGCE